MWWLGYWFLLGSHQRKPLVSYSQSSADSKTIKHTVAFKLSVWDYALVKNTKRTQKPALRLSACFTWREQKLGFAFRANRIVTTIKICFQSEKRFTFPAVLKENNFFFTFNGLSQEHLHRGFKYSRYWKVIKGIPIKALQKRLKFKDLTKH